jgi:hypothetical protein
VTIVTGTSSATSWVTSWAANGTPEAIGDQTASAQLLRELAERLRGERLRHYLHRMSDHRRVDIPEGMHR